MIIEIFIALTDSKDSLGQKAGKCMFYSVLFTVISKTVGQSFDDFIFPKLNDSYYHEWKLQDFTWFFFSKAGFVIHFSQKPEKYGWNNKLIWLKQQILKIKGIPRPAKIERDGLIVSKTNVSLLNN